MSGADELRVDGVSRRRSEAADYLRLWRQAREMHPGDRAAAEDEYRALLDQHGLRVEERRPILHEVWL